MSNHYAAHLKTIQCYMYNYTKIKRKRKTVVLEHSEVGACLHEIEVVGRPS